MDASLLDRRFEGLVRSQGLVSGRIFRSAGEDKRGLERRYRLMSDERTHLAAVERTELKLGLDTFEGESDECLDTAGGGACDEGSDRLFLGLSSSLGGHFTNGWV